VLMSVIRAGGDHRERRSGDRRKVEEQAIGVSGSNLVLSERGKSDRVSGSEEDRQGEGKRHWKLLVWAQDGTCHEGTTPCVGAAMLFVETTWRAPIGSDVTIGLVLEEKGMTGQELIQGTVVWHCSQDDQFKNEAGFGVLLQQQWPQLLGPDSLSGPKEGA